MNTLTTRKPTIGNVILALVIVARMASTGHAQVTIDTFPWIEDFSSGNPFTLANGTQQNYWTWGDDARADAPSLYVTSTQGEGNFYWTHGPEHSRVYAYIDVVIPEDHYDVRLRFDVRVGGQQYHDKLRIYRVPTFYTPQAGSNISTSQGSGFQQIGTDIWNYPEWTTMEYQLPLELAGTSFRLVFQWRNDGNSGMQPPAALDNFRIDATTCHPLFGIVLDSLTTSSASVSWVANPGVVPYLYELRTSGEPSSGQAGLISSGGLDTAFIHFAGLAPGTPYKLHVRGSCQDSLTSWGTHLSIVTDPVCGSMFYDSGGPDGHPSPNVDRVIVICPELPATAVQVHFTQYFSGLTVYDGPEVTLFPKLSINSLGPTPFIIASDHPTGCLTFRHKTGATGGYLGWAASVSCGPLPICHIWGMQAQQVEQDAALVTWHCAGGEIPYTIEYGAPGFAPGTGMGPGQGDLLSTDTLEGVITGLVPGEVYEAYARVLCAPGGAYGANAGPRRFSMHPECGYGFHDSGGSQQNYGPYEHRVTTICPGPEDGPVAVHFEHFDVEPWYDVLYIFDGPDTLSTRFASTHPAPITLPNLGPGGWWGTPAHGPSPGPFVSTDPSGCITFAFISDGVVEFSGWKAEVDCAATSLDEAPLHRTGLSIRPNPVRTGDRLIVSVPGMATPAVLAIHKATGELLFRTEAVPEQRSGELAFTMPGIAAGAYLLVVHDDHGMTATGRLIKVE